MFKDLWKTNLPKVLELLGLIICSVIIAGLVCLLLGSSSVFTLFVAIVVDTIIFYYFGGMIRPYIKDLVNQVTKNTKKSKK